MNLNRFRAYMAGELTISVTGLMGALRNYQERMTDLMQREFEGAVQKALVGFVVQPARLGQVRNIFSGSYLREPIVAGVRDGLRGNSRAWGDASPEVQQGAMQQILMQSKNFSREDRAILLAIAQLESGFNPDAATANSSAAGLFQIVDGTRKGLGLADADKFDAKSNIAAGIKLFKEYLARVEPSKVQGTFRSAYIYALHHGGPKLDSEGIEIAKKNFMPRYLKFYQALSRLDKSQSRSVLASR